jgi:hypothetical protein
MGLLDPILVARTNAVLIMDKETLGILIEFIYMLEPFQGMTSSHEQEAETTSAL